jgi:hypothetical protein
MITPVDNMTRLLKQLNEPVDVVMKNPPGPARWRAAHDLLWRDLSWKNKKTYLEVVEENRATRESVDKFGQALNSMDNEQQNIRNALNIPVGAYIAIAKCDPTVFKEPKNAQKFFNEFKEYTTREIY